MTRLYSARRFDVPLTIDHAAAVRHAQRLAEIGRGFSAVVPRRPCRHDGTRYGDIVPFAIVLSEVLDLHLDPAGGRRLPERLTVEVIRRVVWPAATDAWPVFDVIYQDTPTYEPAWNYGRCPVRGSRGGKCNERGRSRTRWVTNRETGEWEWREMCDLHRPQAVAVQSMCPEPPPNRGGFLDAVFPDLDTDVLYEWAVPGWKRAATRPPEPVEVGVRPALRLVTGSRPPTPGDSA